MSSHGEAKRKQPEEVTQTETLRECGFYGARRAEADVWQATFVKIAGSAESTLARHEFVADCVQRGFDPTWASATFAGTDIDGSGAINLHEYILGRAALEYDPVRDSGTPLVELRLRIAFAFYDRDGDGQLSADELADLVRDLAAGEQHVSRLCEHMLASAATHANPTSSTSEGNGGDGDNSDTDMRQSAMSTTGGGGGGNGGSSFDSGTANGSSSMSASMTVDAFVGSALQAFHAAELSSRDLLRVPLRVPRRTVWEPRIVVAGVVSPNRMFVQSSAFGGGAQDPAIRPAEAANDRLVLDREVAAPEGSSWRGALLHVDDGSAHHRHHHHHHGAASASLSSASIAASGVPPAVGPSGPPPSPRSIVSGGGRVLEAADAVVANARSLVKSLGDSADSAVADPAWLRGGEALCALFSSRDPLQIFRRFERIAKDARRIVAAQPSLVYVRAPAKVFGDIHGQFRDLLALFAEFGFPGHKHGGDVETVSYVFNGDFVDRGEHQLEVVALLFALKVAYPSRIWLVRGNHEFKWINEEQGVTGFAAKCAARFPAPVPGDDGATNGTTRKPSFSSFSSSSSFSESLPLPPPPLQRNETSLTRSASEDATSASTAAGADHSAAAYPPAQPSPFFELSHAVFEWLPLAALIGSAPTGGSVLVLHGGVGDGSWTLKDLAERVPRPLADDATAPPFVNQCLWSDPSDSDSEMARGVHSNPRGPGVVKFGPDVTAQFCSRENIALIVRSHQFVPHGYKVMHGGRLVTVFSARNYGGQLMNDSAVLLVAEDDDGCLRVRPKRLLHLD